MNNPTHIEVTGPDDVPEIILISDILKVEKCRPLVMGLVYIHFRTCDDVLEVGEPYEYFRDRLCGVSEESGLNPRCYVCGTYFNQAQSVLKGGQLSCPSCGDIKWLLSPP